VSLKSGQMGASIAGDRGDVGRRETVVTRRSAIAEELIGKRPNTVQRVILAGSVSVADSVCGRFQLRRVRMSVQQDGQSNPVSTIRLDNETINALLDLLDRREKLSEKATKGEEEFSFRVPSCTILVQQPASSSTATYHVPTRKLSSTCLTFLLAGYVHGQSRCTIQLVSAYGAWETVEGAIEECRHISGVVHEARAKFASPVDVAMYCPEATKLRILLAEDDPLLVKLALNYLEKLNAEVDVVENGKLAVESALNSIYDGVLMDMEMPVMTGFEASEELRKQGYTGTIVACTGLTSPTDRTRCLDAGCDQYISKPYTREDLGAVLRTLQQEPLYSSLANDASMAELIDTFVDNLPPKLRSLQSDFSNEKLDDVEMTARGLKSEAGGYGFEPITDAARTLEEAIQKKAPKLEIKGLMDKLIHFCMIARSPNRKS
jgi:CheY-like chemotaxis protein